MEQERERGKRYITNDRFMTQEEADAFVGADDGGEHDGFSVVMPNGKLFRTQSMKELLEKAAEWRAVYERCVEEFTDMMDDAFAKTIRKWRCEDKLSYRKMSDKLLEHNGLKDETNSLMGQAICLVAAQKLGEDYLEAPWN